MVALIYIIPIIPCIILYLAKGDIYEWWAYALIVWISTLFTAIVHYLMYRHRTSSYEYLGGFITGIRYEEAWTEKQTYTERESDGKGGYRTVTKVRYIYHPDDWTYYTSINTSDSLNSDTYYKIRDLWGTPCHPDTIYGSNIRGGCRYTEEFLYIDLCRSVGTDSPFESTQVAKTMITITEKHRYKNKIKNSNSIFRFENISQSQAEELGLYDYPSIDGFDMSPFVGITVDGYIEGMYQMFNAYYGASHQFRLFILGFNASVSDIEVAEKQRAYWKGGNKNEFVICLGLNDKKVEWCRAFSWMDEPVLSVKVEGYFRSNPDLDFMAFHKWLIVNINKWKRKEFSDFNYISVSLSSVQYSILMLLTIIANICILYGVLVEAIIPPSQRLSDSSYEYTDSLYQYNGDSPDEYFQP